MHTMVRQPKRMLVDGNYVCPMHVAHLVQVSAVLDLSVFYGCAVVGCSYRDRFTFVDVVEDHLPNLSDRSQCMPTVCGRCGSDLTETNAHGMKVCVRSDCSYVLDTIPIDKMTVGQAMARVAYKEERERGPSAAILQAEYAKLDDDELKIGALVVAPALEAMMEAEQTVERLAEALEIPQTPTLPDPDFLALFGCSPNPCAELGVPAAMLATEKVQTLQVCICVGGRSRFCPAH